MTLERLFDLVRVEDPGGLAAILVVEPDAEAARLFDELVRRRDAAGDRVTRFFLVPVEREA